MRRREKEALKSLAITNHPYTRMSHLNEVCPNDPLVDVLLALLVTVHFLRQIAAPAELHDDAQLRVALSFKRIYQRGEIALVKAVRKGLGNLGARTGMLKIDKLRRSVFNFSRTQVIGYLVEECLQKGHDVRVPYRSQHSNFVDCVSHLKRHFLS